MKKERERGQNVNQRHMGERKTVPSEEDEETGERERGKGEKTRGTQRETEARTCLATREKWVVL